MVSNRALMSAVITCLAGALASYPLPAQTAPTLRLLSSTQANNLLVDIDADGKLVFQSPAARTSSVRDEVVHWRRSKAISSRTAIALADGSWLSGRITWKSNESLQLSSDWFDPLELKLAQVRAIVTQPSPSVRHTLELQSRLLKHSGSADQVWRIRGEPITGVLKAQLASSVGEDGSPRIDWRLRPDKSDQFIALTNSDIAALVFSPALHPPLPDATDCTYVTLADASRLRVKAFTRMADGRVQLQLNDDTWLTTLDDAEEFVLAIVELSAHSRRVQWLSDVEPARYRLLESHSQVSWPLGRNQDLFGKPLYADELPIEKALVAHAPAQVAYRYDGQPGKLLASVALWSEATASALPPSPGSAKVQILLGKNNQLVSVYETPLIDSHSASVDIEVELTGAQLIVLLIEQADTDTLGDHVLLRDLRVVKSK